MNNGKSGQYHHNRSWLRWMAAALLLVCQLAMAKDGQAVSRLLIDSGVDAQMPVFGQLVQGTLAQNPALEDGEQREVLQHIAMESFRGDVIYRHVERAVAEALQPGDMETLQLWYGSPLGQKITEMELQSQQADSLPAMKAAAESLMADRERIAAAARLDDLTGASALAVTLQQRALLANHMAESIAADPEVPVDTAALDAQLQQHREPMQQLLRQQTVLSLAFTYRELPVDRIASYESFLATSAAQRYQQGVKAGLLAGVDAVMESWEAGLREYY
ncbi:DUF2059 domain-containing protein [Alcanivorax sp. S6407]|uniref:DUF2059 domain-containing protein n=1 Tax=Alcanivorax sp. S6407 TaxID=2926424 RepID=UPI001FF2714A|nr:DUF2059 domain-containing protein [Alcanivorax sp. S6407]MCK0154720.1 DUF2059 domain-containing protein [Alcanivorax sp. S6407]